MRRKGWIIVTACLAAVLVAAVLIGAAGLVGWVSRQGISISRGQYVDYACADVMTFDDSISDFIEFYDSISFETVFGHMILVDGQPVLMSGNAGVFDGLTTGDRVLVIHGPIAESYPGLARAYLCIKYADGTEDDIPERAWVALKTEGWLSPGTPISEEDAILIANVYTWYGFDIVTAEQEPLTGDWTVDLWSKDRERHETVYISADGTEVTIASGIIYR